MTRFVTLWKFLKVIAVNDVPLELWVVFVFLLDDSVVTAAKLDRILSYFIVPGSDIHVVSEQLIFQTA